MPGQPKSSLGHVQTGGDDSRKQAVDSAKLDIVKQLQKTAVPLTSKIPTNKLIAKKNQKF